MKDLLCDEFQNTVSELLIRHQSILDILSKSQEASARVNRAVIKAVTNCGCLNICAKRKPVPEDTHIEDCSIEDLQALFDSHLAGKLCDNCREIVEDELGRSLFYLTALCNSLDVNLYDLFIKEHKKLSTLRVFNFR